MRVGVGCMVSFANVACLPGPPAFAFCRSSGMFSGSACARSTSQPTHAQHLTDSGIRSLAGIPYASTRAPTQSSTEKRQRGQTVNCRGDSHDHPQTCTVSGQMRSFSVCVAGAGVLRRTPLSAPCSLDAAAPAPAGPGLSPRPLSDVARQARSPTQHLHQPCHAHAKVPTT